MQNSSKNLKKAELFTSTRQNLNGKTIRTPALMTRCNENGK